MRILLMITMLFYFQSLYAQVTDSTSFAPFDYTSLANDSTDVGIDSLAALDTTRSKFQMVTSAVKNAGKKVGRSVGGFFKKLIVEDYPKPRSALIIGMVIPGGGQAYNGSLWKAPLVIGAYGTVIFTIAKNDRQYKVYRDAYKLRVSPDPNAPEDDFPGIQTAGLKSVRDGYRKQRELSWMALFGVALLSSAEGFVDAHLKTFDVSEDLSFKPNLSLENNPILGSYVGVGITIPIR